MKNPFAPLFNRAPKYVPGPSLAPEKEKTAKAPASDPLRSLTADWIETNYRLEVNKGLYAKPSWAFHELSRTCSLLGDKVRFWKAQLAALEWHIAIAKDAQEGAKDADPAKVERAKKHRAALLTAYESLENLKAALKHLASARFYGFSVLRKTDNQLQIVDPWNVIHDIQWLANAAPTMKWHFNEQALASLDKAAMPEMTPAEYIIRECEDPSLLELMRLAYRANKVMDFRERNLEEASKNQVIILTGANMPEPGTTERTALEAALNSARKGESAVIAKGMPDCPTEVHKMDASKGLPFYTTTLDNIDQAMTKAVTGGMLTMLSMPTGIGSGASDTQAATLATLVADEAGEINDVMQKGFDRFVLEKAGLLEKGERPLAYFELSSRQEIDPKGNAELLVAMKAAGFEVAEEQASEMLGMPVKRSVAVPAFGAMDGDINADPDAEEGEDLPNRDGDLLNFDPSQPRDEDGKWTDGEGGNATFTGKKESVTIKDAAHSKGNKLIIAKGTGDWKSRAGKIAEALGGRWTGREGGYVLSPTRAKALRDLHADGWDANYFDSTLTHPSLEGIRFSARGAISENKKRRALTNRTAPDAGFFDLLSRLAKEMGGDQAATDEWFDKLEKAITDAPPEAMMDTAKLEAFLRERMAAARQKGMEDGAKGA